MAANYDFQQGQPNYGLDFPYQNMLKTQEEYLKDIPKSDWPKTHIPAQSQAKKRRITSHKLDLQLPDNSIQTSKYTAITFIPKNLMEQFSKVANVYFLLIGILQMINVISITDGVPTIYLPLVVIVCITAVKDFFEDYQRKRSDREENERNTHVWREEQQNFVLTQWKDVRVGSIVKVEQNQYFPSDLLLLYTSERKGECYIETKNLDGETNLKQKFASKQIFQFYTTISQQNSDNIDFSKHRVVFGYQEPNPLLYKFNGAVEMCTQTDQVSIDASNVCLRGSSLRNTKYIYGVTCYSGHDTKVMMNSFKARAKKSHLEVMMSNQIIIIFIIQMIICTFSALWYTIWYRQNVDSFSYLKIDTRQAEDNADYYNFFIRFGNWILLFSNFVPISLLVTLEMVKFIQAIQINIDELMVYTCQSEDGKIISTPTVVQSSNLNEELGQIEYVFSDKTGTLTQNIMDFQKISINGYSYGQPDRVAIDQAEFSQLPQVTNVDFRDQYIFDAYRNPSHPEHQSVKTCMYMLGLCHNVITEEKQGELIYNASSPDELALVNFAQFCGLQYRGKDENNNMVIKENGVEIRYKLLYELEFNSTRKRQSVILEEEQTGQILLMCKGADSILLERTNLEKSAKIEETKVNLDNYGVIGLRTLLLCQQEIDRKVFEEWQKRYLEATTTLVQREEKMEQLQEEIEKNLILVGATAIEDKLQDRVGETIAALKKAGIKVWVLTGDQVETAINIGLSCKLLTRQLTQHIVKTSGKQNEAQQVTEKQLIRRLDQIIAKIQSNQIKDEIVDKNALIITGEALIYGLKPEISQKIIEATNHCRAVLCCRVSPKQKQQIVTLVRENKPGISTLAIGDGANDVNMITAAHVGVGIKGVEGQQAARASDYSIGEFKILRNLLFVHGRESYRRNSRLVCYNFYKNVIIVMPQFWFSFQNFFSGQTLYDSYAYQLFNVVYASLPIVIYAVFDEEIKYDKLMQNKINYYEAGIRHELFNTKVFWTWCGFAAWQSVIIAYFRQKGESKSE